jgi:hypothetical protein
MNTENTEDTKMSELIDLSDLKEVKSRGKHMTCTDKQSTRSFPLPRRSSVFSALIPCLPLTFRKPQWVVTRPLQSMATTEGPARVHGRIAGVAQSSNC